SLPRLDTLSVGQNRFPIAVLEGFVAERRVLRYMPQEFTAPRIIANGSTNAGAVTVLVDESLTLSVPKSGKFNRTTWKRNGVIVRTDTSLYADFRLPAFTLADTGVYECVITNTQLPEIVLTTASIAVSGRLPVVAPTAVRLITPRPSEEDVALVPEFSWTSSTGAVEYQMEIARDSVFAQTVTTALVAQSAQALASGSVVLAKSQIANPLAADRRYFWRVRAVNAVDVSAWSVGSFTTVPPDAQVTVLVTDLGKISRFDTARGAVVVRNVGVGSLTLESLRADNLAFALDDVRGQLLPGEEMRVPVRFVAANVGNALSAVTVNFRSGMSSTIQTRRFANRLAVRASGLKFLAPNLDTIIVGKTRVASALLVNVSDKPIVLENTTFRQKTGVYTLRTPASALTLQPKDTLVLPIGYLTGNVGRTAPDTLRCVTQNADVAGLRREDIDTADVPLTAFARLPEPNDVSVQVAVRVLDNNVPPGSAVRVEIVIALGSNLETVFKSATPTIRGRIRFNENVLV
ncbi:MAG: immunoglobulin domain-containing protein, partial [Candidatus Kapaibacteriota bacterium]